jgi:hypothetical protein
MATAAQIAANRRNAQASTGPRTADGKRRVSRNAITHGLDCEDVLLPEDDGTAFDRYRAAMLADTQPVGGEEQHLVEEMVACRWRIRRAWREEANIYHQARHRMKSPEGHVGACVLTDLQNEKGLPTVNRKEATWSRAYHRCSDKLQDLRRKGLRHVIEDELGVEGQELTVETSKVEASNATDGVAEMPGHAAQSLEGSGPVGRASPPDGRMEMTTPAAEPGTTPSSDSSSGESGEQSQSTAGSGSGFLVSGERPGEAVAPSRSDGGGIGESAEQSQMGDGGPGMTV